MSCYEALAASYDGLTRDIPYEKYLRFFKSLLKQYGVKPKTVLDLACGTGSLSVLLAKSGYAVLGVDRSEDMLTVAAEKAMELEENQPFFAEQYAVPLSGYGVARSVWDSRRMRLRARQHQLCYKAAGCAENILPHL